MSMSKRIMEKPKPLPWYKRLYYAIEPRFISRIRHKIHAHIMLQRFVKYGLPLIRNPFPTANLKDFVSVEPMVGAPISEVFFMEYKYGSHPADKTAMIVLNESEAKKDIVPPTFCEPQFKPMIDSTRANNDEVQGNR